MTLYRILFGIDLLAAGVILFFFLWGLADGTVSGFNIGLWMLILAGPASVLVGGYALRARAHLLAANLVLLILAAPAMLFMAVVVLLMTTQPNWH